MRGRHIALIATGAAVALLAAAFWLSNWIEVDACLDAGGRWNRSMSSCEHE